MYMYMHMYMHIQHIDTCIMQQVIEQKHAESMMYQHVDSNASASPLVYVRTCIYMCIFHICFDTRILNC